MTRSQIRLSAAVLAVVACAACGTSSPSFHPSTPSDVGGAAGSPLGPSYLLVPLPNDDDTLLGRVLLDVPEKGRSLDEVSRPNACADKLAPKREGPLASTFEDGQELAASGKASAALGAFGFEGDAMRATHFYYKLDVSKRVSQSDTNEYVSCCQERHSCGYGYISALVYGDGTYATAEEDSVSGSVKIPVAGGVGGFVNAKILHRRNVHGYVAAVVTVTDPAQSKKTSVLGDPAAAGIVITEQTLPDQVKRRFDLQKVSIEDKDNTNDPRSNDVKYVFKDGNGPITENEFAQRYRALTGRDDLDKADFARHRARGIGMTVGGVALAGIATGAFFALLSAQKKCEADNNKECDPWWIFAISFGGVGSGFLLAYGISDLASPNGTVEEHAVGKFDAELYVEKYNRLLLKKTIEDTKDRMRTLGVIDVKPVFTPSFSGIVGRF